MSDTTPTTQFDVVSLGETMLRLTPHTHVRLDQATQFNIEVGGTESNTLVGLSRLGLKCTWLSRLPASPLGRLVTEGLNRHGVNTDYVRLCDDRRMGLYFYEDASRPRRAQVIYDRKDSAAASLSREDIDPQLFRTGRARLLHITGITPALSDSAAEATRYALSQALAAGWRVSIDLNYRSLLWSPREARQGLLPLMSQASLIISSLADIHTVFDVQGDAEAALGWLRQRNPDATLVLTRGEDGACASLPNKPVCYRAPIPTTAVGRLGGGDAFAAGFIFAWLNSDGDADESALTRWLDWGVAAASLKYATPGDMAVIDNGEIRELLSRNSAQAGVKR